MAVWFVFCKNCMRFVGKIAGAVPYHYTCPLCGVRDKPQHRRKLNGDLTEIPILTYVHPHSQAYYKLKQIQQQNGVVAENEER